MFNEYGFKSYELTKDFPAEGFKTYDEFSEFIAMNAIGINDDNWEDFEKHFAEAYAERFGEAAAEAIAI